MKRLEIGDECYVRDLCTMEIKKAIWSGNLHTAIMLGMYRLVYPFQCVKELAV